MDDRTIKKYNAKLVEKGICQRQNIARILKEFRSHYPELAHYKRIPGTVQFHKGTNLIEEFFLATALLWLQCYKELNLSSRYEMIGNTRATLVTSDDMMSLVYLELPKLMMIINYSTTQSPKQYFKSRMRMLASVHYGYKTFDDIDYELEMEHIDYHNNEEEHAGI